MHDNGVPSLDQFLVAPVEEVAHVAPKTLIFAAGGTRRAAALAGIDEDSFVAWLRRRMIACFQRIFSMGVQHIFSIAIAPTQWNEVGKYRERLLDMATLGLAGPDALADYVQLGWRVRLLAPENIPEFRDTAARLQAALPEESGATLWWLAVPEPDALYNRLIAAIHTSQAQTRQDAVRAFYGEDVPPATLFLAFGKPLIAAELLPPLLVGNMQCYWTQQPGYEIDERGLRSIFYDYAYLRPTWQADKTDRAARVRRHRTAWQQGPTIGLGMRLDTFWYPAPIASPILLEEEDR